MSDEAKVPLFGAVPPEIGTSSILHAGHVRYYWFLAYHSGFPYAGNSLWWGDKRAAEEIGCSPQTIRRWKLDFERLGLIVRKRHGNIRAIYLQDITRELALKLKPRRSRYSQVNEQLAHERAEHRSPVSKEALISKHINNKGNNTRNTTTPAEPERGSILGAADKADEKNRSLAKREARRAKQVKRHSLGEIKKRAIARAKENESVHRWRGKRFYQHLQTMCSMHEVPIRDADTVSAGRYTKEMNRVIDQMEKKGISKQELKDAIEFLAENWHESLSTKFHKDGISVYDFRHNWSEIINAFRNRGRVEKPQEKISTNFMDFDD
jgi:hypothetical protein